MVDSCIQSPCGSNAICSNGSCSCQATYFGDPYSGCRPECVLNTDCPLDKACLRNKCINPCSGTCGQSALCNVYNHIPMCICPIGMKGNAFLSCSPIKGIYTIELQVLGVETDFFSFSEKFLFKQNKNLDVLKVNSKMIQTLLSPVTEKSIFPLRG